MASDRIVTTVSFSHKSPIQCLLLSCSGAPPGAASAATPPRQAAPGGPAPVLLCNVHTSRVSEPMFTMPRVPPSLLVHRLYSTLSPKRSLSYKESCRNSLVYCVLCSQQYILHELITYCTAGCRTRCCGARCWRCTCAPAASPAWSSSSCSASPCPCARRPS